MTQEEFERLAKAGNQGDAEAINVMTKATINSNQRAMCYLAGFDLKIGQYEVAQQHVDALRSTQNTWQPLNICIEHDFKYGESPLKDLCKKLIEAGSEYGMKEIEVYIPDGTTRIGDYAFHDCEKLTYIYIPDSVTRIGDFACCGCTSLTTLTIPNNVTYIGNHVFDYCQNLSEIIVPMGTKSRFEQMEGLKKHTDKIIEK